MFKYIAIAAVALFAADTQALSLQQRTQMKAQIDEAIDNYLETSETTANSADAEWGFLKNIVNIDRFFDSGVKA